MERKKKILLKKSVGLKGKTGERKSTVNARPIRGKIPFTARSKQNEDSIDSSANEARNKNTDERELDERAIRKNRKKGSRRTIVKASIPNKTRSRRKEEVKEVVEVEESKEAKEAEIARQVSYSRVEIDEERESLDEYYVEDDYANEERNADTQETIYEENIQDNDDDDDGNNINRDEVDDQNIGCSFADNEERVMNMSFIRNQCDAYNQDVSFQSAMKVMDGAFIALGKFVEDKTCPQSSDPTIKTKGCQQNDEEIDGHVDLESSYYNDDDTGVMAISNESSLLLDLSGENNGITNGNPKVSSLTQNLSISSEYFK